jgi:23S rRNA pseudouridine1911/1915/1917 synthase
MALLPGDDGPYVFVSLLPSGAHGKALIDHLASSFAYQDVATWTERIRAGAISLDGAVTTDPAHPLRRGQELSYHHGHYLEPEVPTDWRVADSGADWMAVDKPAGQPIQSTSRIFRQTLVWQVRRLHGEDWSPCHRLDRDTSGLVLFARTRPALSWLQGAFERRRVRKEYLACLSGRLDGPVEADAAIGPDEASPIRTRLTVRADGKESRTGFVPLGYDPDKGGTWCLVHPFQGRRHQIRVHAQHLGHPLVGDPLYDGKGGQGYLSRLEGASSQAVSQPVAEGRMWLHSCSLEFLDAAPEGLPQRLAAPWPAGVPQGLPSPPGREGN